MTTIITGMTPAEFITAFNANVAEIAYTGKTLDVNSTLRGCQLKAFTKLNGIADINYGISGSTYISQLNSGFTSASTDDVIIAGAADVKTFGATGDGVTDDASDINTAVAAGNIIIQNGTFLLSASIKIPSNRTIYLKNCIIKMDDASYDNFFRNSDMDSGNTNIKILGLGAVELDGNCENNDDDYATYGPIDAGDPPVTIYKYVGIIFCKVTTFEISGLDIHNFMHWCISLQRSSSGSVHDLNIDYGFLTVNQDSINVLHGSHDINIYNITTNCADDFQAIAVANYSGLSYSGYADWSDGDVYNITCYDIVITGMLYGSICAFLGGDSGKIHDIEYRDIWIKNGGTIFYSVYNSYRDVDPVATDNYNIVFKNIRFDVMYGNGVTRAYPFYFGQDMMDFSATGIINNTGKPMYDIVNGADVSDNVTINGVQVT